MQKKKKIKHLSLARHKINSNVLTASSVVHRAADPRTHGSEAAHREVGHIPWLKEKKADMSLGERHFNDGKKK